MTAAFSNKILFDIDPHVSMQLIVALIIAACVLSAVRYFMQRAWPWARWIAMAVLLVMLINPVLVFEKREGLPDVVLAVVDDSLSQKADAKRGERAQAALDYLQSTLGQRDTIDFRVITVDGTDKTELYNAATTALADVPEKRRGGVFLITDGQAHDIPDLTKATALPDLGPVHALLTGHKGEKDRTIRIVQSPAYGLVGKDVTATFRIEDSEDSKANIGEATLTIRRQNMPDEVTVVPVGEDQTITIPIKNPGDNIVELSVSPLQGELTASNNKSIIIVNGVRERLRVLLVSGDPSASTQTWREILKSDPGVDLVHFTILREPTSFDITPQREMALIPFPFQQLFEERLNNFNLIIFDHFRLNNMLPHFYFSNIANYVRQGGGFLEISGPSYSGENSVYQTDLSTILPGIPFGDVVEGPVNPALTADGKDHPVTNTLPAGWGAWLRYMPVRAKPGTITVLEHNNSPLLMLRRVEQGRVAQLTSDQIWLWRRGYDGGGPATELMRKMAHWIMKEPDLEENILDVRLIDHTILVRQRDWRGTATDNTDVTVTDPAGETQTIQLKKKDDHWQEGQYTPAQSGVYRFATADGERMRYLVYGDNTSQEMQDLRSTETILKPWTSKTSGGVIWLEKTAKPTLRDLTRNRDYSGSGWLGIRRNDDYQVTGVEIRPLMPPWLALIIALTTLIAVWLYEGGKLRRRAH